MMIDGELTSYRVKKAEALNNYFVDISTVENANEDPPDMNFPQVEMGESPEPFSIEETKKVLHDVKVNSALGPDEIPNVFLHQCAESLAPCMTSLFNSCMKKQRMPSLWKRSHVTPICKGGNKEVISNYTPISLFSCPSKVLERLFYNRMMIHVHIKEKNLIGEQQFGFREGRSAEDQLLEVYEKMLSSVDSQMISKFVFLDASKAFDKVWRLGLLAKLKRMGFHEMITGWLQDYITSRRQRVTHKGFYSTWREILAGVPQGSILGPLLYLLSQKT